MSGRKTPKQDRYFEMLAEMPPLQPRPKKFSFCTVAVKIKLSSVEKPAPTLKLPVFFSVTSTTISIVLSSAPRGVLMLMSSKYPS
mgnify:CR=1 FL=1